MWTGDNQPTAASFFLVYNPDGRPVAARHRSAAVRRATSRSATSAPDGVGRDGISPAANNVNLLVETVVLNYMALHGEQGQFGTKFPRQRTRLRGVAGQPDRVQPDRERHDQLSAARADAAGRANVRAVVTCPSIDAELRCPACRRGIVAVRATRAPALPVRKPSRSIDGIPWLHPGPAAALAEWRLRLHWLLAELAQQAALTRHELERSDLRVRGA